ncbi:hypothetical protein F442_17558 [Phytophthora nicotianae P10297]|uniref:Uncharacterized protein n=1 Tax=Phytophthora nicotianae P10297 TaxID=1317064 RepID=W2YGF5_PHYNI|nr:hypothetical protein F442_17558 [Phytophthora nicotianae P10297]
MQLLRSRSRIHRVHPVPKARSFRVRQETVPRVIIRGLRIAKTARQLKLLKTDHWHAYLEQQVMSHHEDNALLEQQLKLMKQKGEDEALRWDREFAFKSKKLELAERKWNDEVELRRQEMQIRREEIVLLRLQLQASQNQVGNRGADERFPASN